MNPKRTLITLVATLTIINAGLVLGANESYSKFYSGFGVEDPDPDMDQVYTPQDKCSATPFDLWIITTDSKKTRSVITFPDSKTPEKSVYLRLKKVNDKNVDGNSNVILETSSDQKFPKGKSTEYALPPYKVLVVEPIGKRLQALFSNVKKGTVVLWSSALEGKRKGCSLDEKTNTGEITPP